mgnify:FL=1|jgi:DNA replication and repair protein RecF
MHIKTLHLRDFRNYSDQSLELNPGLNIFVGDNAQGKTNLLEAIYVLSLSKSYRTGRETELIKHGANQTIIHAQVQKMARLDLAVQVSLATSKKLLVNQKSTNANSFVGQLNTVLFTPDSLQLVKGSPGDRRRFLDIQICQIDAVYRTTLLKYQRVVRQRNSLLKEAQMQRSLVKQVPVWDTQLVALGSELIWRRQEILSILEEFAQRAHETISHELENLQVAYAPFFAANTQEHKQYTLAEIEQFFWSELKDRREEELRRGYTLVGPQRDDIIFLINGLDLKTFGSQGQQRTAVLAYILAELELMSREAGEYPVVLLDDVMSELDQTRRSFLLSILNRKAQTIVTTTNLASFDEKTRQEARVFRIESGRIL